MLARIRVTKMSCTSNQFSDVSGTCLPCPTHCVYCDSNDECLTCQSGYWGKVCENQCSTCQRVTECQKKDGFCKVACRDGLSGILCDTLCNENCSSCDRTDRDICLKCAPGRYPTKSCDFFCSNCNNTACNEDGVCTSGCVNGYWNKTCESVCPKNCSDNSCEFKTGTCTYSSDINNASKSSKGKKKNDIAFVMVVIGVPLIVVALVTLVGIYIFRMKRHIRRRSDGASRYAKGQRKETTNEVSSTLLLKGHDTVLSKNKLLMPIKPKTGREKLLEVIKRIQTRTNNDYQDEFNQLLMCDTRKSMAKTDSIKKCENQDLTTFDQNCVTVKMDNGENVLMNASFIKTRHSIDSVYIACTGPTRDASGGFDRFWMMLWQLDCKTVVMLNTLDTLNVTEAELKEYWPMRDRPEYYGQLLVKCESYVKTEVSISRAFTVKMGTETKTIIQLQYKEWPERGCAANVHNLLTFLKLVHDTNKADRGPNKNPLVVHDSAGAYQTGTFIALDILVKEAENMVDSTEEMGLDVFTCVKHLREQRMNMVESVEQYRFLHEALSCYITQMLNLNRELAVENLNMPRGDID